MSDYLLIEGFDYYNTAGAGAGGVVSSQWSPSGDGEIDIIAGLIGGGQCLRMGDITGGSARTLERNLPASTSSFSVGAFTRCRTDANQAFLQLRNVLGDAHVQLYALNNTDVQVRVGGAIVGVIPGVWISESSIVHIEAVGTVHPSSGSLDIYIDRTLEFSFAGDTSNHATDHTISRIAISCPNGSGANNWFYFDHLYVSPVAVQHGDLLVDYVPVIADTADKDWVPSTGTANAALLDEVPVAVADYVTGAVVGDLDVYEIDDLSADSSSIVAVQPVILASKTDAGAREVEMQLISGAAQVDTAISPSTTTGFHYGTISDDDPDTAGAWSYSSFNAAKLGLEVTV